MKIGSAEWLKDRQSGIGASEMSAILGLSRYRSSLDIYLAKTTEPTASQDSPQSKRGRRLESVVLDMYEEDHGEVIRGEKIVSKKYPFMFASLDAARKDNGRPVEAKTAGVYAAREWGEEGTDNVPQEYIIQVAHQAIVKETDYSDIAALLTLDDFRRYTIQVDSELADMIIEAGAQFWKRVENREPPEPTTGAEAERLYRKSKPIGIVADGQTELNYYDLLETRKELKPLEAKEAKLIDDIKLFLGEKDSLLIGDVQKITWKTSADSTRFDAKRFQEEQPELAKKYLTQSAGSRRFLVK